MIGIGFLGMMIGLGTKVGIHPGMGPLPHHHLQESQNKTSVTVSELPSSSTSGSGAKVSAVTSETPPGIERTSSPRATGNTCRSKPMLLAAITLGTFGVGNSVLVGLFEGK